MAGLHLSSYQKVSEELIGVMDMQDMYFGEEFGDAI